MLLADVVATSATVAATSSRLAKRSALAALFVELSNGEDIEIAVAYLSGELRQRRTGLGWAAVANLPQPATKPSLTLQDVDAALEVMATVSGPGSSSRRAERTHTLLSQATAGEQAFLRSLIVGDVRQGALDAAVLEAVAIASAVPIATVRRAAMLRGAAGPVAVAALTCGEPAVSAFDLTIGQPVRPMLASSAVDVPAAFTKLRDGSEAVVDTKLDGIRIQAHKAADQVWVYSRSLVDITSRLPEVVELLRGLPGDLVLDGEALALDAAGRPRPFQETAARTATTAGDAEARARVTPFFFDCLYADGEPLIDRPVVERLQRLDALLPKHLVAERLLTSDRQVAAQFFERVVADRQEGVVIKAADSTYDAGRRGAAWIKVKPRHTLDLVVLAVEEGSGRRTGTLSNIHLGARDAASGGYVMLGKTFKGMTDEMLRWQTQRFTELAVSRTPRVVTVRPEQVVEIAFDGIQRSSRYPGGLALRFARVVRYRDDKPAAEADTIEAVRALTAG